MPRKSRWKLARVRCAPSLGGSLRTASTSGKPDLSADGASHCHRSDALDRPSVAWPRSDGDGQTRPGCADQSEKFSPPCRGVERKADVSPGQSRQSGVGFRRELAGTSHYAKIILALLQVISLTCMHLLAAETTAACSNSASEYPSKTASRTVILCEGHSLPRLATLQKLERKQGLTGLPPKCRFIPAQPIERVGGQVG